MLITVESCRKAGYCLKGVKEWCKRNGADNLADTMSADISEE